MFQLLLLSQVTFYYEKGKVVLNKVSLSANQESRIALVSGYVFFFHFPPFTFVFVNVQGHFKNTSDLRIRVHIKEG